MLEKKLWQPMSHRNLSPLLFSFFLLLAVWNFGCHSLWPQGANRESNLDAELSKAQPPALPAGTHFEDPQPGFEQEPNETR